jgi:hypothetical protein
MRCCGISLQGGACCADELAAALVPVLRLLGQGPHHDVVDAGWQFGPDHAWQRRLFLDVGPLTRTR